MDILNFTDVVSKTSLPFIYHGDRLNDEKCKKLINKLKPDGTIIAVITADSILKTDGLIFTEKGIWFSLSKGTVLVVIPKTKGVFLFDEFILHDVTVKKTLLGNYDIEFILWDLRKNKTIAYAFVLEENYNEEAKKSCEELLNIFKTLVSKTGNEYVSPDDNKDEKISPVQSIEDDPNSFDFVWGNLWTNIHTNIVLNEDTLIINAYKFDDKTKIQTPKGVPVTISRSAIASVKKGRGFSPLTILGSIGMGLIIGFICIGGFVTVLLFTIFGFILSFPRLLIIKRKDGTKFKTRIKTSDANT